MKHDFIDRIKSIASGASVNSGNKKSIKPNEADEHFVKVLDELYAITLNAVNIYNSELKHTSLSVYKLPAEFLEIFFEISAARGGICLVAERKLAIYFDEDPYTITVIGKNRVSKNFDKSITSKPVQLLKISFTSENGDEYEYKDNTGGIVSPYDIVAILVNWVVSA